MSESQQAEVVLSYPSPFGYATFVRTASKTFVIYMDKTGGQAIEKALNGICGERPLTHELICSILDGLDCKVRDVLIYKEQEGTFFAKLTLLMRNELGEKIVEIDSRPSDALSIAIRNKAPIEVLNSVLKNLEDVTDVLGEIKRKKLF